MTENAFYYTLSTIPQVIGAITAILIAVSYFREEALGKYLLGEGLTLFERWKESVDVKGKYDGEYDNHLLPDEKIQRDRLRDANLRHNMFEVKDVLRRLSQIAVAHGKTMDKPGSSRGMDYIYNVRFCAAERTIATIRRWMRWLLIITCGSIICALLTLAAGSCLTGDDATPGLSSLGLWLVRVNVVFLIVFLGVTGKLLVTILRRQPGYETDR